MEAIQHMEHTDEGAPIEKIPIEEEIIRNHFMMLLLVV